MNLHQQALELAEVCKRLIECAEAILSFPNTDEWLTQEQKNIKLELADSHRNLRNSSLQLATKVYKPNSYKDYSSRNINQYPKALYNKVEEESLLDTIKNTRKLLSDLTGTLNFAREKNGLQKLQDESRPLN